MSELCEMNPGDLRKLVDCPWCKEVPHYYYMSQGYKWGGIECDCGARGPEVRTSYDESEDAPWHKEAIEEWNKR